MFQPELQLNEQLLHEPLGNPIRKGFHAVDHLFPKTNHGTDNGIMLHTGRRIHEADDPYANKHCYKP